MDAVSKKRIFKNFKINYYKTNFLQFTVASANAKIINYSDKSATCEICEKFFSALENFLSLEEVVNETVAIAQYPCRLFDLGNITNECFDVVDSYVRNFLKELVSELDPAQDCSRFCSDEDDESDKFQQTEDVQSQFQKISQQKRQNYNIYNMVDDGEFDDSSTVLNAVSKGRKHPHHRKHRHHHRKPKTICEFSLTNVQNLMNVHDKSVILALNSMCSYLDVSSSDCEKFVNTHFTEIFNHAKTSPSDKMCESLQTHLQNLNEFSAASLSLQFEVQTSAIKGLVGGDSCFFCTFALKEILGFLQRQDWIDFEQPIEGYCSKLTDNPSIQNFCIGSVDFVFTEIENYLDKPDLTSKNGCRLIGMCNSKIGNNIIEKHTDRIDEVLNTLKPFATLITNFMMMEIK